MKKIIYIILFVAIISLISISELKADTNPTYVTTLEQCYLSSTGSGMTSSTYNTNSHGSLEFYSYPQAYPNAQVFIYDTGNDTGEWREYSITYFTGWTANRFVIGSSFRIYTSCQDDGSNPNGPAGLKITQPLSLSVSSPVPGNTYTFGTHQRYIYINQTRDSVNYPATNSWGFESSGSNVVISTIPEVEIPDTDFYLFFDFNTIADFNIFSSYDFTSFTDYEKVSITIIINIFYLGFIGFCIYLLAKGLYKMLSWVFR